MTEIITSSVLFIISIAIFIMSIRSFMEKGFLFNNAYIYASKEERERMDKKPHYRQTAVVLLCIGVVFLLNGIDVLLKTDWILYALIAVLVFAVIYGIVSSILIERKKK